MLFTILLTASAAFLGVANALDIIATEGSIKEGGDEANDWAVGPKPKAWQLGLRDGIISGVIVLVPALINLVNPPLALGALAGPIAAGIIHLRGWRNGVAFEKANAPKK